MRIDRKGWQRSWMPFLWCRWCYAMMESSPATVFTCWVEWKWSLRASLKEGDGQ